MDATAQRVDDPCRLLEDLLEHEVLVALLLRADRIPRDSFARPLHRFTAAVEDLGAIDAQHGGVAVFEKHEVARVPEHGGNVGRGECRGLGPPEHHRRGVARDDEMIGVLDVHHDERVRPCDTTERLSDGSVE